MPVQAQRGDGGIAPNDLRSWHWNSVGCWPGPYPAAICWGRHTHCTGGWMGLRACLVRHGKISPSLDFNLRSILDDQGLIPDRKSMFSLLSPMLLFLTVCKYAVYWHLCWWWYIRWILETQYWKWRWWSYEVDHTPSCGTEIKNVCSFTLNLPWNGDAVEIVTWAASLLCFFMCLHLCIDH
jgi:hypothetical protein